MNWPDDIPMPDAVREYLFVPADASFEGVHYMKKSKADAAIAALKSENKFLKGTSQMQEGFFNAAMDRAEQAEKDRDYYEMRLNEEMAEKQVLRREKEQAEAELAKAPTWPTVEALQEQLKAAEARNLELIGIIAEADYQKVTASDKARIAELEAELTRLTWMLEFAVAEWERGEIPPDDRAALVARYEEGGK